MAEGLQIKQSLETSHGYEGTKIGVQGRQPGGVSIIASRLSSGAPEEFYSKSKNQLKIEQSFKIKSQLFINYISDYIKMICSYSNCLLEVK